MTELTISNQGLLDNSITDTFFKGSEQRSKRMQNIEDAANGRNIQQQPAQTEEEKTVQAVPEKSTKPAQTEKKIFGFSAKKVVTVVVVIGVAVAGYLIYRNYQKSQLPAAQ